MPRLAPELSRELDLKMLARAKSDQALGREYGLTSAAMSKRRSKLSKLAPEALAYIKKNEAVEARKGKEDRDNRRQEAIRTLLAAMTPFKRKLNVWSEIEDRKIQDKKPPLTTQETFMLARLLDILFKEIHQEEEAERDYQNWFEQNIQFNFQNINIMVLIDEIEKVLGPEQAQKLRDYYAKKPMEDKIT